MKKLVFALVLFASPAFAQTEDEMVVARKKFDTALAYEKQGDWTGALALMKDVGKIKTTSQVKFHIALCLENLHRLVEARQEYINSKEEADIKEGASGSVMSKKAGERIADLDARIPRVELIVPEEVINAKLVIDSGAPIALIVDNTILLDPGDHTLTVYATSRKNWVKKVSVKERDPSVKMKVELPFDDEPAPTPVAKPPEPTPTPTPAPRRVDTSSKWDAYPWIFGGVGLASLAVGGIMYAYRDGTIHDMDQACGPDRDKCPRNVEDIESRGRTYTSVGNIFLGVGVAALATGVVLYVVKPKARDTATTTLSVAASPSTLGVTVVSAF
jgi:hypothetical protein